MKETWDFLKTFTQARVGLSRSGHAVGTREQLEFQWAHAQARDAIHTVWDEESLISELSSLNVKTVSLKTAVQNRSEYLTRPDLGRKLDEASIEFLKTSVSERNMDIAILISNGLSSEAIHRHAAAFLKILIPELRKNHFKHSSVYLIPNARVAVGDFIGDLLKPKLSLILIGERPGLSSPDSMGLYLTYKPELGKTDKDRNCISNIREPHGLPYTEATYQTLYLVSESLRRNLSGVNLKLNHKQ